MSATLFAVEFIADKIPGFDLLWNALHTFIRVPVAALLAYRATTQLTPGMQVLATAVGAAIALAAHGSKTAARALVTPSPEPVSNIALSSSEDVAAVGITWLATAASLGRSQCGDSAAFSLDFDGSMGSESPARAVAETLAVSSGLEAFSPERRAGKATARSPAG